MTLPPAVDVLEFEVRLFYILYDSDTNLKMWHVASEQGGFHFR